ncbi:hypothetical protein Ami103574_00045 [Aminipila butyrica]|uniref:Uncharacterized protein n=1 Tax=Aminipila butyrica TaxID=433296 RepID=A0A858BSM0_9FIRM|nr:hypothetical protein [Aminipila butyrica]QIB67804.1 hypothetical protein Ami103574_00045 [Aminipila butyrica]
MLSIEEYIAKRKKEDRLDEFDGKFKDENLKICVNYIFEYFMNYISITEFEMKSIIKDERVEEYRKTLRAYEPEIIEWLTNIYDKSGKYANRIIGNMLEKYDFFSIFNTESEFREVSYELYKRITKRIPELKGQSEMIFQFIKAYHKKRAHAEGFSDYTFSNSILNWLEQTRKKYGVNIAVFAYKWLDQLYENKDLWPNTNRKDRFGQSEYDYTQKRNVFNLESLYRNIPKKAFIRGKKQELEALMMYIWLHNYCRDENGYWDEYSQKVLPIIDLQDKAQV